MNNNFVICRVIKSDGAVQEAHMHNLRTNDGDDYMATHLGSVNIAPIRNISLTTHSVAPASTDTNLISEQAADGLSRKTATFSHTAGASSYTQTATWNYTGSSTLTLAKAALCHDAEDTDASTDTHFCITLISPVAVVDSGDTVELAWGIHY